MKNTFVLLSASLQVPKIFWVAKVPLLFKMVIPNLASPIEFAFV